MSEIKQSALELIGNTPLLQLNAYSKKREITEATVLAKLEYLNPAGSVKDRIAKAMIDDAEEKGLLLGAAPETFLGNAIQTGRKALDEGKIGEITGFNVVAGLLHLMQVKMQVV